jgi:hypothetical protein
MEISNPETLAIVPIRHREEARLSSIGIFEMAVSDIYCSFKTNDQ